MSDSSSPPSSPSARYSPPLELVARAEDALRRARPSELAVAQVCYEAYASVTEGRSAVTGSELPRFGACPPLVRASWLAVALTRGGPLLSSAGNTHAEDMDDGDGGQVDPLLLGISEIATATRELAEAERMASGGGPVAQLVDTVAGALEARVKALDSPAPAS